MVLLFSLQLLLSCGSQGTDESTALFNGQNLNGFHIYNKGNTDSKWKVKDNELLCDPHGTGVFGDLVTDDEFENFELEFQYKVSKGGNSGVFINVKEDSSYAAVFETGLEMQLLDNVNAEPRHQRDSTHWSGCLYAVDCIGSNSQPNPYHDWNTAKIKQQDGKVTFWLNDKVTFQGIIGSEEFTDKVTNGNMKHYPAFAKSKKGKIAFQNHTDSVSFRNIRVSILQGGEASGNSET